MSGPIKRQGPGPTFMTLADYNRYLFHEFAFDLEFDVSKVSEEWPFKFTHIEDTEIQGRPTKLYSFDSDGEEHYLVEDSSLNFHSKDGLEPNLFKMVLTGASWIGDKDPTDLSVMDNRIPRIPEKKARIAELWKTHIGDEELDLLEGLFLGSTKSYLALGRIKGEEKAHVFGNSIVVRNIPFPDLSPWKRLAIGIGKLVIDKKI